MFDLHHRYKPRQVIELLAEMRNVGRSESGPSSSRPFPAGAIVKPPLQIATVEVSMKLDSNSDEGSNRDTSLLPHAAHGYYVGGA
ncbi:hypothetical protein PIB30_047224 [Stylosanthes scabra]|uniref:Uncharacterized protein n=1 Tax=Stylosanthes scabra TaxID=79078 RepID=A0ABU6WID2_9FABA|nr:hypothetical protein [Stylosanthes scabra]